MMKERLECSLINRRNISDRNAQKVSSVLLVSADSNVVDSESLDFRTHLIIVLMESVRYDLVDERS